MNTRTGNFPIGFRRLWMDWHKDLPGLISWAKSNGLAGIDIGRDADTAGRKVLDAGLKLGSIDLKVWQEMISPSKATRKKAIASNAAYIEKCAALGQMNYFVVMLPEDPARPRAENFDYMVESFAALAPTLEKTMAASSSKAGRDPAHSPARRKAIARCSRRCRASRWASTTTPRICCAWASTRCAS